MTAGVASRKPITQGLALLALLAAWVVATRRPGIFPAPERVLAALVRFTASGELPYRTLLSLEAIAAGLALSLACAFLLTGLGFVSRAMARVVDAAVTIMHPLPEMALLPLVILWVGIGFPGILFLVFTSALWPFLVNCAAGFRAVPPLYLEVGRNIGLRRLRLIAEVLVPATAPYLVAGLKTSWARAWRAVVGAEMVMGISAKAGGLGWFIYEAHYDVDIARILAGISVIILIGLAVESRLFEQLEARTVRRWGMTR